MDTEDVLVELEGLTTEMDPLAVADAIRAMDKILRSLECDQSTDLRLSKLAEGSALMGVRSDSERVNILNDGLSSLATTPSMPAGWNLTSLAGLQDLNRVSDRSGVKSVRVKIDAAVVLIDEALSANVQKIVGRSAVALGSIRGTLYRYTNDGSRRSAGIRDYRTGHPVEIMFSRRLADDLKRFLDVEVTVWGELRRDAEGMPVKISIEGIEAIVAPPANLALGDMAGILGSEWTNGVDPVEWVRQQRG